MKGLFLSGYGCKPWIWEKVEKTLTNYEIEFVEWPTPETLDFHKLSDFTNFVKTNYLKNNFYDFLIGHSMGGLVALELSTLEDFNIKNVIIVEAFLLTPSTFFQNLVMKNTSVELSDRIISMLKNESKFYSPMLGNQLKVLNITDLVEKSKAKIHCIYGDRGENDELKVINQLGLPISTLGKLDISIVNNACHFPMLENPNQVSEYIIEILK